MSLTSTYDEWVETLEPPDRVAARALPGELGASGSAEPWDAFVRLEPNRSLPRFVARDCARELGAEPLARWVKAHRLGGFFGFLLDCLSDKQVVASPGAARTCRLLGLAWHEALVAALADECRAAATVTRCLEEWRSGVNLERVCLEGGLLEPCYAQISRLKNGWVAATTAAMLEVHGAPGQAAALLRAYDCFLFALQCRDDVDDADEDARLRGSSIPALLGLPAGALVRAAPLVLARGIAEARTGGLAQLADWLEHFNARLEHDVGSRDFHRDSLLAMIVAARMDQELANSKLGRPPSD